MTMLAFTCLGCSIAAEIDVHVVVIVVMFLRAAMLLVAPLFLLVVSVIAVRGTARTMSTLALTSG